MAPPPLDSPHAPACSASPPSEREEKDDRPSRELEETASHTGVDAGSRFLEGNINPVLSHGLARPWSWHKLYAIDALVRVSLSYPSEQQPLAERINHVLQSEGHTVFYGRDGLPAGQTYGDLIRHGIQRCHLNIPLSAKYIHVQLRYIDGSDPERKKIPIVEEDIDR